ncbi:hypothetical protein [Candidatus Cyanaurora vandensis]|uniref:hypothetical protein n=1 Tax=Candidatus Cyanaurora vandensis TaxID=2714958 RepID=UPI00257FBA3D|nr:hypothetical protein [Candidatus Cyanaurora vandensis]
MKRSLLLALLVALPVSAKPVPIYLIRARDVGSTDLARTILYVRVPDQATDREIAQATANYAAQQAKARQVDEITVWIDLAAATDCEKLAGKPYLTYSYPAKTLKPGFSSRPEYLKTIASLRAKGSCKPLY